jgi:hypothetical protein
VALEGRLGLRPGTPPEARSFAPAEGRRGRGPGLAVAREAVGTQLGADRDQRGQVGDGLDRPHFGHPHEAVRVEVVAQQERGVYVGWSEEPRPAVVQQVTLVDRLQPKRVALLPERREDPLELALVDRPQCFLPEAALASRLPRDRLPDVGDYNQRARSLVQ